MSIRRRLEQLEKSYGVGSPYCCCPREIVTQLFLPNLNEAHEDRERRNRQTEERLICDQCRKEIERIAIIVKCD